MKKYGFILFIMMLILIPSVNADAESSSYIIKIKNNFPMERYKSQLEEVNKEQGIYTIKNEILLAELGDYIETAEPNNKVDLIKGLEPIMLYSTPTDSMYSQLWQLDMININSAWNMETYGNEIRVGVIDSGCYQHVDLKNNLVTGKNYFDGSGDISDNIGHGTHVCGVVAAEMNEIGVVGAAPKAKIVPLKCFDNYKDTEVDMIVSAIYDAVNVFDCHVINMSWGLTGDNKFLREALEYARDSGVILVAAVGNSYSSTIYYPAAYDWVIGVGSVTETKAKSNFSQFNKSVFVVAPGSGILSTYNNGNYKKLSGTSQATPMVSALAAIMLSADENKTAEDFKNLLISTSEDLGVKGYDVNFGYGLINTEQFMKKLLQNKSVYISPLCTKDGEQGVYYYNLTDTEQDLFCIEADYDNNKMDYCTFQYTRISENKPFFCRHEALTKDVKYMAWENFNSFVPKGNVRTIKKH